MFEALVIVFLAAGAAASAFELKPEPSPDPARMASRIMNFAVDCPGTPHQMECLRNICKRAGGELATPEDTAAVACDFVGGSQLRVTYAQPKK